MIAVDVSARKYVVKNLTAIRYIIKILNSRNEPVPVKRQHDSRIHEHRPKHDKGDQPEQNLC